MFEPFKISRVLPPHELNARRARKRILPQPPPVAQHVIVSDDANQPSNAHVFNHGADPFTHHE